MTFFLFCRRNITLYSHSMRLVFFFIQIFDSSSRSIAWLTSHADDPQGWLYFHTRAHIRRGASSYVHILCLHSLGRGGGWRAERRRKKEHGDKDTVRQHHTTYYYNTHGTAFHAHYTAYAVLRFMWALFVVCYTRECVYRKQVLAISKGNEKKKKKTN
jgi:hypothetical protein